MLLPSAATAATIYIDPGLSEASCTTYDPDNRGCAGGTDTAYRDLASGSAATGPGDAVRIRGGTFSEPLVVAVSGDVAAGAPITYQAFDREAEPVTITDTGAVPGLLLEGINGVIVDGLVFDDILFWAEIIDGHDNVIRNCSFSRARDSGTRSGLKIVRGSHNRVEGCAFYDGNDELMLEDTDHNVIIANTFGLARHTLINVSCSSFNVMRDNYFYNATQKIGEEFDCEGVIGSTYHDERQVRKLDATKHNLWEGNTFAFTPPNDGDGPYSGIQYAGQLGIIRRNVFYDCQGAGLDLTQYSDEALHCFGTRAFNNTFYGNAGGGVLAGNRPTSADGFYDNRVENNLIINNVSMPLPWDDNNPSGSQVTIRSNATGGVLVQNNGILGASAGDGTVVYVAGTRMSLADAQANHPGLFADNVELDPEFADADGHEFGLQDTSEAIDGGRFLASTTSAGSGKTLPVSDVGYFYDGYGIAGEVGDRIRLESTDDTARIEAINWSVGTLTLDVALTWTAGQGVALDYSDDAPDLGAIEHTPRCTDAGDCTTPGPCETAAGAQCSDGACSYPADVGAACDDGDPCTSPDTCNADRACVAGANVCECHDAGDCTAPPTCHTAVGVTCVSGSCSYPAAEDGTTCPADAEGCTADVCRSGACAHVALSGLACDDGNACTHPDSCSAAGTCEPGPNTCSCVTVADCVTPPPCRTTSNATCVDSLCDYPAVADGTPCAADDNTCTSDACQTGACVHAVVAGALCNDDNRCTGPDTCDEAGVCIPGPRICVDDAGGAGCACSSRSGSAYGVVVWGGLVVLFAGLRARRSRGGGARC
jgi:hypothetical protein